MEMAIFLVFALTAVVFSIMVVANRNPVYSTLALVVVLIASAGFFVLLGSPFLAALQVLLYTGAILVLFLFVIMLLNVQRERTTATRVNGMLVGAGVCALVLVGALARLFWNAYSDTPLRPLTPESVSLAAVARDLFGTYLLPFEMIGLLLLVAVVAASWVAQRTEPGEAPEDAAAAAAAKQGEPR